MAYTAFAVAGTLLQMSAGSPVSYLTIRGVEGFQGPTASKPDIDVTAIDDTASQFLSGVPDYGNVTFDLFWDPADTTHQAIKAEFDEIGSRAYFQIVAADDGAAVGVFEGEVKGWEHDFSKGAAAKVKVTVKLSGAITWTP